MATGNLQNNWRRLLTSLQSLGYCKKSGKGFELKDFDGCGWLAIVHYCLLDYSPLVASTLAQSGYYDLNGKKDGKFIHLLYRLLTELYCYVPSLRKDQMLMSGFVERKILFVIDLIKLVQQHHLALRKNRPFDARKSLQSANPIVRVSGKPALRPAKTAQSADIKPAALPFPQVSFSLDEPGDSVMEKEPSNANNPVVTASNNTAGGVLLLEERRRRLKEFQHSIERPVAPAASHLMTQPSALSQTSTISVARNNPEYQIATDSVNQWFQSVDYLFQNAAEEGVKVVLDCENSKVVLDCENSKAAEWETTQAECREIDDNVRLDHVAEPQEQQESNRQEFNDDSESESDIIDHYTDVNDTQEEQQKVPVPTNSAKQIIAAEHATEKVLLNQLVDQVQMMTMAMQRLMERVEVTERLMQL